MSKQLHFGEAGQDGIDHAHIVAVGRGVTVSAVGSHGPHTLRAEPAGALRHLATGGNPCVGCEHKARLECRTVKGCPVAEAWAEAVGLYRALACPSEAV